MSIWSNQGFPRCLRGGHPPASKEDHAQRDGQAEAWWGVLFAAFMVGLLLGSLLVWQLSGH